MRKEVKEFAEAMEEKLKTHDVKKGDPWKWMTFDRQEQALKDGVKKLEYDLTWYGDNPHKGMSQCLDIANYVMFIYSKLKEVKP